MEEKNSLEIKFVHINESGEYNADENVYWMIQPPLLKNHLSEGNIPPSSLLPSGLLH